MSGVIISTKDRPGSYDAIETAKPDEPLFPIQGGDPFGPPTVLHWAGLARAAGLAETDEKRADRLLRKASDAEEVAWEMQRYQRGGKDDADPDPKAGRVPYSGHQIELSSDADRDRKVREARIKGADRLHNIIGMASEIADQLDALEACVWETESIRKAIAMIKEAAGTIEPRRENERS